MESLHLSGESDLMYDDDDLMKHLDGQDSVQMESSTQEQFSGYSLIDTSTIRTENMMLKANMHLIKQECQSEQDLVNELRKKLMVSEREKLENSSKANEQRSVLQSQVAKLRAALEKGEAESQSLQYELARVRQEAAIEKRNATERGRQMMQLNENTKQKLTELTNQMDQLCEEINEVKRTNEEDQIKFSKALEDKENVISGLRTEKDVMEAENERLAGVIRTHERTCAASEERIKELEDEKRRHLDEHKQTLRELAYKTEKEEQLKRDLEEALQRSKTLEENIEAERAAHLESKFNSEIVQLRVHELEGALEVEKSAKHDATAAIEKLNRQLSALEEAYDEETKSAKDTKEQLKKFEIECSSVREKLTHEVENKTAIIQNLSAQLEPHQKNFDELKEELMKAKKRQIYLEETYGDSMKELELLIKKFQADGFTDAKNKTGSKSIKTPSSPDSVLLPSEVLQKLHHVLSTYKNGLEHSGSELTKLKSTSTTLNKELASLKKVLTSKERVLEETQQNLTKATKELNKLRMELSQLQTAHRKTTSDLQSASQNGEKERIRANGLSDELVKVARKHRDDNEEHMKSLHGIYQHLLAGHIIGNSGKEVGALNGFTWIELTSLVHEQISTSVNSLRRLEEKARHLEVVIQNKEKLLGEIQSCHQGQLERLAVTLQDQQLTAQQQKQQLDQHYKDMLDELQAQSKKQQVMADQAWERVRATGSVQQSLQTECSQLQQQLKTCRHEQATLLTTCALLTGAIYPLFLRTDTLAEQKSFIQERRDSSDHLSKQIQDLISAVSFAAGDTVTGQLVITRSNSSPLLTFRVAAIAVIAANRLQKLQRCSYRMFALSAHQVGATRCMVWAGRKARPGTDHQGQAGPLADTVTWLKAPQLMKIVKKSMSGLHDTIHNRSIPDHADGKSLTEAAKTAFLMYMEKVGSQFEDQSLDRINKHRDKASLAWQLSLGLKRVLSSLKLEQRSQFSSPQQMLSQLHKLLLRMSENMHAAEVERRSLRQELSQYRTEHATLQSTTHKLSHMQEQLQRQKEQSKGQVASATFESVCRELDSALQREEQAQQLLREHSHQLQQLHNKLQVYEADGAEKSNSCNKAAQELSEIKMELRRKEQALRQLGRSVSALQAEKQSLQEHLKDAENTLHTAAKDKDTHSSYINSLITSVQMYKQHLQRHGNVQDLDFSALLSVDLNKTGSEVAVSRSLLSEFVDLYRQVAAHTAALQEQITSRQNHIEKLKNELNAACKREMDEQQQQQQQQEEFDYDMMEKKFQSTSFGSPYKYKPKPDTGDVFLPLMEDTDLSYSVLQTSPKGKHRPVHQAT